MNPFDSSVLAKVEMAPIPAPWNGVEVVADEMLFSGMLDDVLVAALGEQSGEEKENAPANKNHNATGQPVQNPTIVPVAPPELAPVSPPTSDEASPRENNPLQVVRLPSVPETNADESLSPAQSDTKESLLPDVSTTAGPSNSATKSSPREPGKGVIAVPAEKTETAPPAEKPEIASPAATRVVKQVAASDDPTAFTVSAPVEASEGAPVVRGAGVGLPVNVSVSSTGPEDNQAAPAESGPVARKRAKAAHRADAGTSASRPGPNRKPGGQADAAGRGTEADEGETASASSRDGGSEAGSLRGENRIALSEGMNPRTPDERIPLTLRPGTNAHVLNGPKTTGDSTLYRMDGGVAPRVMSGHILSRVEQFQEFVSRLGHHILSASADREKIMTVTLVPESLGKVVLNCREQGGHLWVEIQAASQSVREVLQRQEEVIRQMMDQSGYTLMQFDVRSQTGGGDPGHFHRQSQEDEEAAAEAVRVRPAGVTPESAPAVAPSPTAPQRGLWIIA